MHRGLLPLLIIALAFAPMQAHANVSVVTTAAYTFVPGDDSMPEYPARMGEGSTLVYVNADAGLFHTLTSVDTGPDGEPLFDSGEPIGVSQFAIVEGAERLAPGSYRFLCLLHTDLMAGMLIVEPGPALPAGP